MAKAASNFIANVKGEQGAGKAVNKSASAAAGKDVNVVKGSAAQLSDPFGSKAVAQEQEDRLNSAIDELKNADPLKSSSVTDQSSNTTSSSTTKDSSVTDQSSKTSTSFAKAGKTEEALTKGQLQALESQKKLVADQEKDILAREGVQTQARDALGNVLGGQAFDLSASENERINRLREANIGASRGAVDELLTTRLAELEADAARRGVRGQAYSQLQGDVLGTSARELQQATLQANQLAAQQAIDLPGARAGVQASTAGGLAGFADQLQQQAIENQSILQDPVLKQQLLDERLKAATTSTTGKTSTTGTSQTTGTSATTGQSTTNSQQDVDPTAAIMAKAQAPGPKASTVAGNVGGIGVLTDIAGAAAPFV
jgi:hypothetical protein